MSVDRDEKQETSWKTLLDCGKASDTKTLSDWKDELGILLTFTGLFSAVVTGFIVLAIPLLQEDSGEKSARLLAQISLQLSSFHISSQFINSTASVDHNIVETFQPDVQAVRINILWISSLTCTLMASFFTIAAQQWIRCIPLPPHLTIREAVRLRQYRQDGLIRWKVPTMISLLPVVVQISVVLFLAGLLLLLNTINSTVATVFAVLAGSTLGFFVITVFLPVIVANCPFKTPFIPAFVAVGQFCAIPIIGVLIVAGWMVGGVVVAIGVSAWNIQRATVDFIEHISKRPVRTRSTRRPDFAPVYNTFRDVFILRCLHAVSAIFRRWFWTNGEYWLSHELASTNDADLDRHALSHSPTFVPKDQLAVLRPCLDALPVDHRLHVATSWARHSLSLSSKAGLLLNSSLHAMSYTGPLRHAPRSAFLELRQTLWYVLPKAWDPEWHDDQNRILSMMLCLLFRSLPDDANAEPEFFADFGKRVFDIRNSQDMGSVMPEDSLSANASIIPTSLLFHCCQRGVVLDRDQILAASAWTSSLHVHIRTNILHQEQVNPHIFRPDIMRVGEISITSAAVVFQAVARNQAILSDETGRARFDELVETSAKIIRKLRRSLITYTSHISVMPTGTHILACNEAIKAIARSVIVLAEEGNIAQRPDCPSRRIMSYLREVCEANWETTFEDTMVCFDQYDALYVGRYGTQAQ